MMKILLPLIMIAGFIPFCLGSGRTGERCARYTGQFCRNFTSNSPAGSLHDANVDEIIHFSLSSLLGVNVTEACRQILLVGLCASNLSPCDQDKVWCGELSLDELRLKAGEECKCEVGTFFAPVCTNESRIASLNSYFAGVSDKYFKWDPDDPAILPEGMTCQLIGLHMGSDNISETNDTMPDDSAGFNMTAGVGGITTNTTGVGMVITNNTSNTTTGGGGATTNTTGVGVVMTNNTRGNISMVTGTPTIPTKPPRRMCVSYAGDVCRDVIGEALISNLPSSVPGLEREVRMKLGEVAMGNSFNSCLRYYNFVHCVNHFKPCGDKMWCGPYTIEQLAEIACHCVSHTRHQNVTSDTPQGVPTVNTSLYAQQGHPERGKMCEAVFLEIDLKRPKGNGAGDTKGLLSNILGLISMAMVAMVMF